MSSVNMKPTKTVTTVTRQPVRAAAAVTRTTVTSTRTANARQRRNRRRRNRVARSSVISDSSILRSLIYRSDTIAPPILPSGNSLCGRPVVQDRGDMVVIRHREFVKDILSSKDLSTDTYLLNPGSRGLVPWLARLAINFEEWVPLGIALEYKSSSGDAVSSTNPALGMVIMATQYDTADTTFNSRREMEDSEFAISAKASQNIVHYIECSSRRNPLATYYVRNSDSTIYSDHFYDLGSFSIATVGQQTDGNVIGELWISYEIGFRKPKLADELGDQRVTHWHEYPVGQASAANPFGANGALISAGSYWSPSEAPGGTNFITIPDKGKYFVMFSEYPGIGTGASSLPTYTFGLNVVASYFFADSSLAMNNTINNGFATTVLCVTVLKNGTGVDNRLTVGGLSSMSGTYTDIIVIPVPSILKSSPSVSVEDQLKALKEQVSRLTRNVEDELYVPTPSSTPYRDLSIATRRLG